MWRVLDGAVRRLDHVRFVDVTNRGFALLHVTADRVSAGWHWVDPYDPDDTPGAGAAQWLAVEGGASPPAWRDTEPPALPVRAGQDLALPPRPEDVPAMRRRHQRRRAAGLAAVTAGSAGAVAAVLRALRR